MANLFLITVENERMLNLKKSDPRKTHSLANDFALICAISDNGLFEKTFQGIFP